jgi:hypothetical protein
MYMVERSTERLTIIHVDKIVRHSFSHSYTVPGTVVQYSKKRFFAMCIFLCLCVCDVCKLLPGTSISQGTSYTTVLVRVLVLGR